MSQESITRSHWSIPLDWPGETVFIIGGGTSVNSFDPDLLRGRRIIALNSSWERFPFADVLVFGDSRWWGRYGERVEKSFPQQTVGVTASYPRASFLRCRRRPPPGLSHDRQCLTFRRTIFASAINLATHRIGPGGTIILCGADGQCGPDGRTHHHESYPWPLPKCRWEQQREDLETLVQPLAALNVRCFNASSGTAWTMFPQVALRDALDGILTESKRPF